MLACVLFGRKKVMLKPCPDDLDVDRPRANCCACLKPHPCPCTHAADPLTAHAARLEKEVAAVISDRDLKRDELTALTAEHAKLKATLENLIIQGCDYDHDEGAFEGDCRICCAWKEARALLDRLSGGLK